MCAVKNRSRHSLIDAFVHIEYRRPTKRKFVSPLTHWNSRMIRIRITGHMRKDVRVRDWRLSYYCRFTMRQELPTAESFLVHKFPVSSRRAIPNFEKGTHQELGLYFLDANANHRSARSISLRASGEASKLGESVSLHQTLLSRTPCPAFYI